MGFERGPLSAGYRPALVCDVCRGRVGPGGLAAYLATLGDDVRPVLLACGKVCFDRAAERLVAPASAEGSTVEGMAVAEYLAAALAALATRRGTGRGGEEPAEDYFGSYP